MDLIDRDKLIEAIGINRECECCQYVVGNYSCGCDIPHADICEVIVEAPTIEVPKWIPCSERLPEYLEEVLMSTFWGVRVGFRDHTERSGDFWNIIENDSTVAPHSVYAWMPLPKPYEETKK